MPRFKYQQIAQQLAAEVQATLTPGARFPSEPMLCERLGVTRDTVRKAIDLLAADGVLEKRGRAGNFVARQAGGGQSALGHLACVAMPLRNHLWDRLFLGLAHEAGERGRQLQPCDFSQPDPACPGSGMLSDEACRQRLRQALATRCATLIVHAPEVLPAVTDLRDSFRRLILLKPAPPGGFDRVAAVYVDVLAAWALAGRHARQAGYQRLAIFLPPSAVNLSALQARYTMPEAGAFPLTAQTVLFEHHPHWPAELTRLVRQEGPPLAVVCSYDWGAHLALQVLHEAGADVPGQVGLYGMNDTPWSLQDGLTTVAADDDDWARAVFAADDRLAAGERFLDVPVAPRVIPRASTR
jgi:DNA-binding LacI/PurR family transcriptional regulator